MFFSLIEEAANKTMEESLNTEETAFSTFEMRHSRRGTMSKRSTVGRRSVVGATAVVNAKSPPRPAPASVTYSDDDTVKGYDENPDDSSELTEKPTDLSSTASEVCSKIHLLLDYPPFIQLFAYCCQCFSVNAFSVLAGTLDRILCSGGH